MMLKRGLNVHSKFHFSFSSDKYLLGDELSLLSVFSLRDVYFRVYSFRLYCSVL